MLEMQKIVGIGLKLLSGDALSENWVTLKTPPEPMGGTPPISSVNTESIEMLKACLRSPIEVGPTIGFACVSVTKAGRLW
jgi:hypothetical protein